MPTTAPPAPSAHPKLTNNKKDGKKAAVTVNPPPVVIWDDKMRIEYRREEDAKRAFLGEVSAEREVGFPGLDGWN